MCARATQTNSAVVQTQCNEKKERVGYQNNELLAMSDGPLEWPVTVTNRESSAN